MRMSQAHKDQLVANQALFKAQYAAMKVGLPPAACAVIEHSLAQWDAFISAIVVQ